MARGLAIPQRVASVPLSTCRSRDDEPIDAERQPQLFPQPFEVRTTRANESSLQVFPVVVIATTHVGTSLLVDDRAISVEQAAHDCEQVLFRDRERPDREALPVLYPDAREPPAQSGITDLRSVVEPTRARTYPTDLVALP